MMHFLRNVTGIVFVTNVFIRERALGFLFNRRTSSPARLKVRVFILQPLVQSNRCGDLVPLFRAGPPCGNHRQCHTDDLPVWGGFVQRTAEVGESRPDRSSYHHTSIHSVERKRDGLPCRLCEHCPHHHYQRRVNCGRGSLLSEALQFLDPTEVNARESHPCRLLDFRQDTSVECIQPEPSRTKIDPQCGKPPTFPGQPGKVHQREDRLKREVDRTPMVSMLHQLASKASLKDEWRELWGLK